MCRDEREREREREREEKSYWIQKSGELRGREGVTEKEERGKTRNERNKEEKREHSLSREERTGWCRVSSGGTFII